MSYYLNFLGIRQHSLLLKLQLFFFIRLKCSIVSKTLMIFIKTPNLKYFPKKFNYIFYIFIFPVPKIHPPDRTRLKLNSLKFKIALEFDKLWSECGKNLLYFQIFFLNNIESTLFFIGRH